MSTATSLNRERRPARELAILAAVTAPMLALLVLAISMMWRATPW